VGRVLDLATSVHPAADDACVAVTAGADTPLRMNAGPADPAPGNFGSGGRPARALGLALRGRRVSEVGSAGLYPFNDREVLEFRAEQV
jgi:hypothetical protein